MKWSGWLVWDVTPSVSKCNLYNRYTHKSLAHPLHHHGLGDGLHRRLVAGEAARHDLCVHVCMRVRVCVCAPSEPSIIMCVSSLALGATTTKPPPAPALNN